MLGTQTRLASSCCSIARSNSRSAHRHTLHCRTCAAGWSAAEIVCCLVLWAEDGVEKKEASFCGWLTVTVCMFGTTCDLVVIFLCCLSRLGLSCIVVAYLLHAALYAA